MCCTALSAAVLVLELQSKYSAYLEEPDPVFKHGLRSPGREGAALGVYSRARRKVVAGTSFGGNGVAAVVLEARARDGRGVGKRGDVRC